MVGKYLAVVMLFIMFVQLLPAHQSASVISLAISLLPVDAFSRNVDEDQGIGAQKLQAVKQTCYCISGHCWFVEVCLSLVPLGPVPGTVGSAVGEHYNSNGLKLPCTAAGKHFSSSGHGSSRLKCSC